MTGSLGGSNGSVGRADDLQEELSRTVGLPSEIGAEGLDRSIRIGGIVIQAPGQSQQVLASSGSSPTGRLCTIRRRPSIVRRNS